MERITILPQSSTPQEQHERLVEVLRQAESDPRLKVVVLFDSGGKGVVFVPDSERKKLARFDERIADAHVVMMDEKKARRWGVI